MDILALVLTILAILAALASVFVTAPPPRSRLATVGVALALFFAAVICQWVNLTDHRILVPHH